MFLKFNHQINLNREKEFQWSDSQWSLMFYLQQLSKYRETKSKMSRVKGRGTLGNQCYGLCAVHWLMIEKSVCPGWQQYLEYVEALKCEAYLGEIRFQMQNVDSATHLGFSVTSCFLVGYGGSSLFHMSSKPRIKMLHLAFLSEAFCNCEVKYMFSSHSCSCQELCPQ